MARLARGRAIAVTASIPVPNPVRPRRLAVSEHPITPSESVPADFADVFDEWIGGATIAKRSVPIYGKPGLYAEFQDLERRLELLESLGEDGGEFAGSE